MQEIFFQCGVLSDRCVRGEEGHDRDQARDRLGAARQGRDRRHQGISRQTGSRKPKKKK